MQRPLLRLVLGAARRRTRLRRWFPSLPDFRPTPVDDQGQPLQRAIVQAAMQGRHVLGILPTGTGKSICYPNPGAVATTRPARSRW